MARRLPPHARFTAAAIAALIATLIIVGSAAADERTSAADATVAAGGAPAQPMDVAHPESLKLRYLRCERAARQHPLDGTAIMSCSVVYEELKQGVFGGSFDALNAWWLATRDRVVP